jgi:hypothetical protein
MVLSLLRCHIGLVFSIYDSTEVAIQKMIEASERMIRMNSNIDSDLDGSNKKQRTWERAESPSAGTAESCRGINSTINEHLELQINMLQNAPRDARKLEWLLKTKRREKEEAKEGEDAEKLATEIEMLKVVLFLVCRKIKAEQEKTR